VDLIAGQGEWPRPGRIFAAARSHRFRDLAEGIDDAFARWDRSPFRSSPWLTVPGCAIPILTGRSKAKSRRITGE
jgi:hypothetical protein